MFAGAKRLFGSKRPLWLLEFGLILVLVVVLIVFWIGDISIDAQYVPTIIGGLTSAISLLIGFGVACLAVIRRYHSLVTSELVILWLLFEIPLLLMLGAYGALIFKSDFGVAVRLILSGFVFSILVVASVLFLGLNEVW